MKKIFISYRRTDAYEVNRLANALKTEYGDNNIFVDIVSISAGEEWPEKIKKAVKASAVFMLIIGRDWLFMQDERSGRRRIDMPGDWVRKEITTFLDQKKKDNSLLLLPVLINGAKMPDPEYLDNKLNKICSLQTISLPNTMRSLDFIDIKRKLVEAGIYTATPLPVVTPVGEIPPNALTADEEENFLCEHAAWSIKEHEKPGGTGETIRELYRVFEFNTYDDAWKFVQLVNEKGIQPSNHHPRLQHAYNRVEIWLCTFNINYKPSKRDVRLADIIDGIWNEFKPGNSSSIQQHF